ncbi:MAG: AAA family ATPase, partial [Roseburia sp.]|nr:AAA family ATPase [Roseburia sp.]
MSRIFNVSAVCIPELHYMVDITDKLEKIKAMVDAGQYFAINRARQYGKTTTLQALEKFLKKDYVVVSLDFQMIGYADFESEQSFSAAFSGEILDAVEKLPDDVKEKLKEIAEGRVRATLSVLFKILLSWCRQSEKKIVLLIDEVDSATNNQVFLDFLAQLRGYYIKRNKMQTFHSVILAGVYDVKNLKRKFVAEDDHKLNSPWNIAADFLVDMSFSTKGIAGMLAEYENDHRTGMNIEELAGLIYDYTSGYPFLVSRICKLMDEQVAGMDAFPDKSTVWTKEGFLEAVKLLLAEKNTLFESLFGKLEEYPELKRMLYTLLFQGQSISYSPFDHAIAMAWMFGFVKAENNTVVVANRIFEMLLYDFFLMAPEMQDNDIYKEASRHKNQFVRNGRLNMELILEKFVTHFNDLYGDRENKFHEEDGRRYFLLYLRPIINGTGNYYIEAQTRNMERTDVIVDYQGEQFIIEMKVW